MTESNREFANSPEGKFWQCCRKAHVRPSTRQASKFRNKKGIAYKVAYGTTDPSFG